MLMSQQKIAVIFGKAEKKILSFILPDPARNNRFLSSKSLNIYWAKDFELLFISSVQLESTTSSHSLPIPYVHHTV